ncbi:MAG TPA: hypothetical protein VI636_07790 [Candidatus Angelobacter sp.]
MLPYEFLLPSWLRAFQLRQQSCILFFKGFRKLAQVAAKQGATKIAVSGMFGSRFHNFRRPNSGSQFLQCLFRWTARIRCFPHAVTPQEAKTNAFRVQHATQTRFAIRKMAFKPKTLSVRIACSPVTYVIFDLRIC